MNLWKLVNKLFQAGLAIYAIVVLYIRVTTNVPERMYVSLAVFPCLIIPWVIKKVFRYTMSDMLTCLYYIFILLSVVLGSVEYLYESIWWFDLFAHGISGVFTSVIALIFLKHFDLIKKKLIIFQAIFLILFTISVAGLWEVYEFTTDKITGEDTQWVELTGVDDTMTDIIIASVGGLVGTSGYLFCMIKDEKKTMKFLEKLL